MNLHVVGISKDSAEKIREKRKTAVLFPDQNSFNYSHIHLVCQRSNMLDGDYVLKGPLVKVLFHRYLTISGITDEMKEKLQGDPVELLHKSHPNNDGFPNHTQITYVEFEYVDLIKV